VPLPPSSRSRQPPTFAMKDAKKGRIGIFRAHPEALAPPRIMPGAGLERAKRVDPARADPAVELRALLGQEAAVHRVLLRAREIDLAVRGVQIAHHQHALAGAAQLLHALEHGAVEVELVRHAAVVAVVAAALRKVSVHHHEPAEARDLEPALGVEAPVAERGLDRVGLAAREQPDPAVAALRRRGEIGMPAARCAHLRGQLVAQRAHLLHADDLGARVREPLREALACARAQAVHVPGDDARCLRSAPRRHRAATRRARGRCTPGAPGRSA